MMLFRPIRARSARAAAALFASFAGGLWTSAAHAQIVITADRLVSDTDTSLDNQDVVVHGATLTINGAHTLLSLRVERNESNQPGVVTHTAGFTASGTAGTALTITANASIEGSSGPLVASRIDASSRGQAPQSGPGAPTFCGNLPGAGYGGAGGPDSSGCDHPGVTYGSISAPADLGSGGADARGGGAIHLIVGGTLTIDGSITADGAPGVTYSGGSGGSVWISCASFQGAGPITAIGGNATYAGSGGSGGGRIAIFSSTPVSLANIHAFGGSGFNHGGAGTTYVRIGAAHPTVYIDNGGATSGRTDFAGQSTLDADLVLSGGAIVGPSVAAGSMNLTLTGDLHITSGTAVSATATGFPPQTGPGAPTFCGNLPGAGYGGAGGPDSTGCSRPGETYGSVSQPTDLGSGGTDGRGGGALHLTLNTLTIDAGGVLSADGAPAVTYSGGSGGSIWLTCNSIQGSGLITANGGNAVYAASGGSGGGRIAIYAPAAVGLANFRARGGSGFNYGGAGTIFVRIASARPTISIDNGGATSGRTDFGAQASLDADINLSGGASFGPPAGTGSMDLTLTGDLHVASGSRVSANGLGYPAQTGPGAPTFCGNLPGAGYGGAGGADSTGCSHSGTTYGSADQPTDLGSGGADSAGGGAIRLTLANLTLDAGASVSADGAHAVTYSGGSGGSIWLHCSSLRGQGSVSADGASAVYAASGGSGGGRIAISTCDPQLPAGTIHSSGGHGFNDGNPGSVALYSGSVTITQQPMPLTFYRGGDTVSLTVGAVTAQNPPVLTYQWRRTADNIVTNLNDGDLGGTVSGAHTPTLTITHIRCQDGGLFDCVVSDACGGVASNAASVAVFARADYNLDGRLDVGDFLAYLAGYAAANPRADFNNDGQVNVADFLAFLSAYATGC
jgi:hypothetical protein